MKWARMNNWRSMGGSGREQARERESKRDSIASSEEPSPRHDQKVTRDRNTINPRVPMHFSLVLLAILYRGARMIAVGAESAEKCRHKLRNCQTHDAKTKKTVILYRGSGKARVSAEKPDEKLSNGFDVARKLHKG